MKRSTDRILTTHVGSLPRPADLLAMMEAKEKGGAFDRNVYEARLREAVAEIVNKQVELGIDVDRRRRVLQAELRHLYQRAAGRLRGRQGVERPESLAQIARGAGVSRILQHAGRARAAAAAEHDLHRADHLQGPRPRQARHRQFQGRARQREAGRGVHAGDLALERRGPAQERLLQDRGGISCSRSPTRWREEYKAIVDAGFLIQIDDPRLVSYYTLQAGRERRRLPEMGGAADRRAQSRAARHPDRENPLPHLLQHQHGSAHPRHAAQGLRRPDPEDPRRRLFVRGGQPAPRARMEGVGNGRSCRRARSSFPA